MITPQNIIDLLSATPTREDLIQHLSNLQHAYQQFYESLPVSHEAAGIAIIATNCKIWRAVASNTFVPPTEKDISNVYTFLSKLKADPLKAPVYRRGKGFVE